MKKLLSIIIFAASTANSFAQISNEIINDPELIARIQLNQPGKVSTIYRTEIPELYEVHTQERQIIFTNNDGKFFLIGGQVVDFKSRMNFTAERKSNSQKVKWDDLPFQASFTVKKGTGERKMAVFTDPDCPYCKRLETDIKGIDNVTISYFMLPIDSLHPKARAKAVSVWCSESKQTAWDTMMATGVAPTPLTCDNPLGAIQAYASAHRINATPTIINGAGFIVEGAPNKQKLDQFISSK